MTDAEKKALQMRAEGYFTHEITAATGINEYWLRKLYVRENVPMDGKKFYPKDEILELYAKGMWPKDIVVELKICETYGVTEKRARNAVNNVIYKNKISRDQNKKKYQRSVATSAAATGGKDEGPESPLYQFAKEGQYKCRNCGGDAYPNRFYCPTCHSVVTKHTTKDDFYGDVEGGECYPVGKIYY